MKLFLQVTKGPLVGKCFPITGGEKIGREKGDIVLPDPKVSNTHAVVKKTLLGKLVLSDQKSKNGIKIQGKRVVRVNLDVGSKFQLGSNFFLVTDKPPVNRPGKPAGPQKPRPTRPEELLPLKTKTSLDSPFEAEPEDESSLSGVGSLSGIEELELPDTGLSSNPAVQELADELSKEIQVGDETITSAPGGHSAEHSETINQDFTPKLKPNEGVDPEAEPATEVISLQQEENSLPLQVGPEDKPKPGEEVDERTLVLTEHTVVIDSKEPKEGHLEDLSLPDLLEESKTATKEKPQAQTSTNESVSFKTLHEKKAKEATQSPKDNRLRWNNVLENFSRENIKHIGNTENELQPFQYPLKLTFYKGVQAETEWVVGYGPRFIGPKSLDLPLLDEGAPGGTSFSLHPHGDRAIFKTEFSNVVKINGKTSTQKEIRSGDIITVNQTEIEVEILR